MFGPTVEMHTDEKTFRVFLERRLEAGLKYPRQPSSEQISLSKSERDRRFQAIFARNIVVSTDSQFRSLVPSNQLIPHLRPQKRIDGEARKETVTCNQSCGSDSLAFYLTAPAMVNVKPKSAAVICAPVPC